MERIWGGRRLESLYGKRLPPGIPVGESWEIVDREEAQSVVSIGDLRGRTLHHLWMEHRREIFGELPDTPRFPLLLKLLNAQEKLSVQVHPPEHAAQELGGEPKTEFWYIADASPNAELYVGLKADCSAATFSKAVRNGSAADQIHRVRVAAGDSMFLPSGRVHAIGAGNLIVEIQQNSDTTYRVFDWNRTDRDGTQRELHVEQAMRSIDFDDHEPSLVQAQGESLVRNDLFAVEKWNLSLARDVSAQGAFAIVCCLTGGLTCADVELRPGEIFLVSATQVDRTLKPLVDGTTLLRVTLPGAQAR